MFLMLYLSMISLTTSILDADDSIPILSASILISSSNVSSCTLSSCASIADEYVTPLEFWAVIALIALKPYAPRWWITLVSSTIPAPPYGSNPAMVNTVGVCILVSKSIYECLSFDFGYFVIAIKYC